MSRAFQAQLPMLVPMTPRQTRSWEPSQEGCLKPEGRLPRLASGCSKDWAARPATLGAHRPPAPRKPTLVWLPVPRPAVLLLLRQPFPLGGSLGLRLPALAWASAHRMPPGLASARRPGLRLPGQPPLSNREYRGYDVQSLPTGARKCSTTYCAKVPLDSKET